MRKEMEKELKLLKEKNKELFDSSQALERALDQAIKDNSELNEDLNNLEEEKEMLIN